MSELICRCFYDGDHYKITSDCPAHSNNSAVAYLRAENAELRKDRERLEWWERNARDYWFEVASSSKGALWVIYKGRGNSQGGVPFVEGRSLPEVTDAAIAAAGEKGE